MRLATIFVLLLVFQNCSAFRRQKRAPTIGSWWRQVERGAVRAWRGVEKAFNRPPTIKCNSDSYYEAGYFKDYVEINLGRPGWEDDKYGVRITQVGGPKSGSKFYEGRNAITYKATDTEGATDYCVKYVTIKVIKCRGLATPDHGSKRCDNDDNIYGTDCYFSCNTGYKLKGYSKSSCEHNGYFDHRTPTCNIVHCNILSTPTHGSKHCDNSQNVYGTTCTFSCDKGFELSGYRSSTCQSSGSYSYSAPTCKRVECPLLVNPTHGTSFSCTNGRYYDSVCSLRCETGYRPTNGLYAICRYNKQWSTTSFECKAIQCSSLTSPSYGTKVCDKKEDVYGTECTFGCDDGFIMEGYEKSKCLSSGSYTHTTPKCKRSLCDELELPAHGSEFRCTNGWYFGSVCSLECGRGYTTVGGAHIMCDVNNTWTKSQFSCEGIQCNILATPSHGSRHCNSNQNVYGTACTFKCDKGFELIGHNTSTCLSNGSYSHPTPTCSKISCPLLEVPEQGSHFKCTDGRTFGSICSLECEAGYATAHGLYAICQYNKHWSSVQFTCKAIQCSSLVTPPHGSKYCDKEQNVYGTECTFSCDKGFTLDGYITSTCESNGTYSHPSPKCNRISCPKLEPPDHGVRFTCTNEWYFGSVCSLECESGYWAVDGSHIMCHFSKTWTRSDFVCKDTEKPKFTNCPSSTITSVNMTVSWPPLEVEDNSGHATTRLTIGQPPGSTFSVGYHVIKYDAQDSSGNKAYPCVFTVKVEALFCPHPRLTFKDEPKLDFIDCKPSQTKFVENTICQLGCDRGSVVGAKYVKCERNQLDAATAHWVTKNAEKPSCISEMPKSIGIHFTFPKERPKNSKILQYKVQENKCPPLRKPKNGDVICNKQNTMCKIQCNVWYDTSENSVDTYICRHDQMIWFPTNVVQDCSAAENRSEYRLSSEFYYISNHFDDEGTETKIKKRFNDALKIILPKCRYFECNAENITVKFINESQRSSGRNPLSISPIVNKSVYRHRRSLTGTLNANEEIESSGDHFTAASEFDGSFLNVGPGVSDKSLAAETKSSENIFNPELSQNGVRPKSESAGNGKYVTHPPKVSKSYLTPELINNQELIGSGLTTKSVLSENDFSSASGLFETFTSNSPNSELTKNYSATPVPHGFENNSTKGPQLSEKDSTDIPESSNSLRSREQIRDQLLILSFDLVISATKTNAETAREILSSVVRRTAGQLYGSLEEFPLYDFKIYYISVQCPAGFTHAKKYHGRCVACGVGTYHKGSIDSCLPCSRGTYQPSEGQTSCFLCPAGTSTLGNGTESKTRCLDTCKRHEYSLTGLQPCSRCPGGTIQPLEGSTFCQMCPLGTMISERTGDLMCISRENCRLIRGGCDHICEMQPGRSTCICKHNYKLQEDGFTCIKQ